MNLPIALEKYLKEKYWFCSLEKDRIRMYKIDQSLKAQDKHFKNIEKIQNDINVV